jgi:hypothetical protein
VTVALHGRRRFTGRDPDEPHRATTPLELLYDLTIVLALGLPQMFASIDGGDRRRL